LVSAVAAGLVADRPLDGFRVVEVGTVQLRGFTQREAVYAVDADHLAPVGRLDDHADPVGAHRGRLPTIDDALVGRIDELTLVWDAVQHHHVVSIVGAGGMGKTRVALEAATAMADGFAGGVWWCELAAATSPDAVAPVVLNALDVRQAPGLSAVESIIAALAGADTLVVLDNCEHVVEAARDLVRTIRMACPTVRLLITSREALGIAGEHLVALSSLPADDALELFIARATAVRPSLHVVGEQRQVAVGICARLDGIPLAVELAAARCRSMTLDEINHLLHDRFRLLRSGRPGVERHRTLQAAVAWSYDLLNADEQRVFDRMAVFADGTYLDGLVAVTGGDEYDLVDLVDRLIARSMVAPTSTEAGTRYSQLETLRQFAEDRLVEQGALGEARDAHLHWIGDLARWMRTTWGTHDAGDAFQRYIAEVDTIRSAVAHAVASGQQETAAAIVSDCGWFLSYRPTFEALDWLDPSAGTPPWSDVRVEAMGHLGVVGWLYGDTAAPGRAITAVPADYHHQPPVAGCHWLEHLWRDGDPQTARTFLDTHQSVNEYDEIRTEFYQTCVDASYAMTANPDPAVVATGLHRAANLVDRARRCGDPLLLGMVLAPYCWCLTFGGRTHEAVTAALEISALGAHHSSGFLLDQGGSCLANALAAGATGDSAHRATAASELRRILTEQRQRHSLMFAAGALDPVAALLWEHDPRTAYLLTLIFRRTWGTSGLVPDIAAQLDPDIVAEVDEQSRTMDTDRAVVVALDALDRYLTAIDPDVLTTPEPTS
jgi:predicted ATPase